MNLGSFRPLLTTSTHKSPLGINQKKKGKKTCTVNNYGFKTPHLVLSKYSHTQKKNKHTHTHVYDFVHLSYNF